MGLSPEPSLAASDAGEAWLEIESLDLEGQGVAHTAAGKVMFVEGALPGESVQAEVIRGKNNWAKARMTALRRESPMRVEPKCPHFGVCGGCKIQHLDTATQLAVKQRVLEDALKHLGKVKPTQVLRAVDGPAWGYRHRARLSMFDHSAQRKMLLGFHERASTHVADIAVCPVMPDAFQALIGPLHRLMESMEQRHRLPQIEVAVGADVIALVLRHLVALSAKDLARLRAFAQEHGVQWWLQPHGPESVHRLDELDGTPALSYELPEFGIVMPYRPTDFTQVNPWVNQVLVSRAVRLLDPQPEERVIDWFCGLGNFSLPLATRCRQVLGVEGSAGLVARAKQNAERHGLGARTGFSMRNLFEITPAHMVAYGAADKWLIDPPRDGAFALVRALVELIESAGGDSPKLQYAPPSRIVYVSCDPSTLARDAGLLVHRAGYECTAAGVVNMFPHTAHVESIAVFDRPR